MKVQITIKGLKPNEDNYIESKHIVEGNTEEELQDNITSTIYEIRNKEQYYKIKYTNIEPV